MAKTGADLYAIKKCVNGTLTEIGGKAKAIKVDFCNTFDMETSSDKITARADGVDVITWNTSIERTFTLGSECMSDDALALLVGGTIDTATSKITVPKDVPSTCYSYEGTFTVVYKDGTVGVKTMKIPKVQPNVDNSLSLSSVDLSTFEVQFNILSGDEDFVFTIEPKTGESV